MPRCQHSNSLCTYKSMFGNWRTACGACALLGPIRLTESRSIEAFWVEVANLRRQELEKQLEKQELEARINRDLLRMQISEENTMPTYEDGYRKGVQDATKELEHDNPIYTDSKNGGMGYKNFFDKVADDRRKSLLTKKVTKWVRVYYSALNDPALFPGSYLYDSEKEAQDCGAGNGAKLIKVASVEIEIPL